MRFVSKFRKGSSARRNIAGRRGGRNERLVECEQRAAPVGADSQIKGVQGVGEVVNVQKSIIREVGGCTSINSGVVDCNIIRRIGDIPEQLYAGACRTRSDTIGG